MCSRIVKRERAIEMRSPLCNLPSVHQGDAHDAMRDHERDCCSLLLGELQELHCKLAWTLPVNAQMLLTQIPKSTENNNNGSSGGSPTASASSINSRARSPAAMVSGSA